MEHMTDDAPEPTDEGRLLEQKRKSIRPVLSVRNASFHAGISEGRWRQIAKGFQAITKDVKVPVSAPATTIARMARVVGATPGELAKAGRKDAAAELDAMINPSLWPRTENDSFEDEDPFDHANELEDIASELETRAGELRDLADRMRSDREQRQDDHDLAAYNPRRRSHPADEGIGRSDEPTEGP